MKLFTHNMLTSKMIRNVQVGYPLKLSATEIKNVTLDFQPMLVTKLIPRVNWPALFEAAQSVGQADVVPENLIDDFEKNEEFLKKAHHALFEIEIITGELECPETGRKFTISNGIPNMLVNEDEV